jgi:hypothetical protein
LHLMIVRSDVSEELSASTCRFAEFRHIKGGGSMLLKGRTDLSIFLLIRPFLIS